MDIKGLIIAETWSADEGALSNTAQPDEWGNKIQQRREEIRSPDAACLLAGNRKTRKLLKFQYLVMKLFPGH